MDRPNNPRFKPPPGANRGQHFGSRNNKRPSGDSKMAGPSHLQSKDAGRSSHPQAAKKLAINLKTFGPENLKWRSSFTTFDKDNRETTTNVDKRVFPDKRRNWSNLYNSYDPIKSDSEAYSTPERLEDSQKAQSSWDTDNSIQSMQLGPETLQFSDEPEERDNYSSGSKTTEYRKAEHGDPDYRAEPATVNRLTPPPLLPQPMQHLLPPPPPPPPPLNQHQETPHSHLPFQNQHLPKPNQHLPISNPHLSPPKQHLPSSNQYLPSTNEHLPSPNPLLPPPNQHLPSPNQHLPSPNQHLLPPPPKHLPQTTAQPQHMPPPQHHRQLPPHHLPPPDLPPPEPIPASHHHLPPLNPPLEELSSKQPSRAEPPGFSDPDLLPPSRPETKDPNQIKKNQLQNVKNLVNCDLCEVGLSNGQELEEHLDSTSHWNTLEYIQRNNDYDDMTIAFLQDVMLYKSRKCSRAIEDTALQALQEYDHMTKVEMFQCAACNVLVPTSASAVQNHITTQEHMINTKSFEARQRRLCLDKASTMMKELMPQFQCFVKGMSPFD